MKKFLTQLDASDVMTFGGLALTGYGISLISLPAALIAVGTVLLGLGIYTAIPRGAKKA
jgi:hypothetical protein